MCANFILPCGENHYGFFLRCPTSFYNQPNLFWATLAATVLAFVLSPFSIQADGSINYAMFFIAMLLLLFAFVVNILLVVRKCRAFGHGVGFAIGMLFFEPIFTLILGFGSSAYLGPQD